jgi:hypothetical protein
VLVPQTPSLYQIALKNQEIKTLRYVGGKILETARRVETLFQSSADQLTKRSKEMQKLKDLLNIKRPPRRKSIIMKAQIPSKKPSESAGLKNLFDSGFNSADFRCPNVCRQIRDLTDEDEESLDFSHFLLPDRDEDPGQNFSYGRRDTLPPNPLVGSSMQRAIAIEARSQEMIPPSKSSNSPPMTIPRQKFKQSLAAWGLNCCGNREAWKGKGYGENEERIRTYSLNSLVVISCGSSPELTRTARFFGNNPVMTLVGSPNSVYNSETSTTSLVPTDTEISPVHVRLDRTEQVDGCATSQEALGMKHSLPEDILRRGRLESKPLGQMFLKKREPQSASSAYLMPDDEMSMLDLSAPKKRTPTPSFLLDVEKHHNSSGSSWRTSSSIIKSQSPLYDHEDFSKSLDSAFSIPDSLMDSAYLSDLAQIADITPPRSSSSESSLSIDSSYFCRDHTGSGSFVLSYPSLESSATTSEFGFHPTMKGKDILHELMM